MFVHCVISSIADMALFLIFCVSAVWADQEDQLKFPNNFKFGVATSAYQIEGAWNEEGKGENIWDRLVHDHPSWIADRTNGDVACDSYHKLEEDIRNLKWLGVDFYRFSISWSRLLPSGYADEINQDGLIYYNNLIDNLIANGITPMVTLYHWDLPQPLQEAGGWPNVVLADYFEDYARVVFANFGDRVKLWITFNEPPEICQSGYAESIYAPAYTSDGIADYLCGRTVLLAHARAYRLYHDKYNQENDGQVGITINGNWYEPETNSPKDIEAAERCIQMNFGWWAHPIFSSSGDYPEIMKQRISEMSKKENFPRSRLLPLTDEEVELIQGTYDFFGLNHYSSRMVSSNTSSMVEWKTPSLYEDVGVRVYFDPSWPSSAAPWLKKVPWGFRKLIRWISKTYGNPIIYVTENGWADKGELQDNERIGYYQEYLRALLDAIEIDKCDVRGYAAWSLMDNFEWREGYTQRYGLFYVNFTLYDRIRTAKDSAVFYKELIKTKNHYVVPIPVVRIMDG